MELFRGGQISLQPVTMCSNLYGTKRYLATVNTSAYHGRMLGKLWNDSLLFSEERSGGLSKLKTWAECEVDN